MIASAPGKIMLAGEYAVLTGGTAILIAVDRRVRARVTDTAAPQSEFLAEAAALLGRDHGPAAAAVATRVIVDSDALRQGERKLGLGSSAAATVAAVAAALAAIERFDRAEVGRIAAAAHAAAQARRGAAGSGADVAAATWGGTIAFAAGAARAIALPAELAIDVAWTGAPADTATLVAAVDAARHRAGVDAALAAIAEAARALAEAAEVDAALAAFAQAAAATESLATATGVAIVPPAVRALAAALAGRGAVVKTTGAGGGDLIAIARPRAIARAIVDEAVVDHGLVPLALAVDPRGVDIDPSGA